MRKAKRAQLQELEQKFFDLVWYARKPPADDPEWLTWGLDTRRTVLSLMMEIEGKYPEDVDALRGEEGDWHHGFNSGALAALRLALGGYIDEFPFLDT